MCKIKSTLRARGVCSRIPHFAAIAVLCSLPVHSAPNKLPNILTYRLRQIKQNLVASLVASCEWLCRSLFRIRTQFREEVHPKRVRQLRRRAEREVHVLVQHLRDVRPRHFHPLRQFRLRNAQFLHPLEYPPQKRRSYSIYRFHIFPAVIMDESLSCIWLSPLTAPWGSGMCKFCTYHFAHQFPLFEDIVDVLRYDRPISAKQLTHLALRQPHRLSIRLHLKTSILLAFLYNNLLIHATCPSKEFYANFAKSSSQVSEPRRRTRNRLCRLYRCLFPLLLNNHKDASGIRRTSICRSRRQEHEAVHHLSSHSAMQSPRCRISGVPDAR